jgi:hypothetical protein
MCERHLSSLPFELAYLAMLTRYKLKRLSRWEHGLSEGETSVLRQFGLLVEPIERRTFFGRRVMHTVLSIHGRPVDLYISRFQGKRLSSSPGEVRLKGFLFGYPSCCVEEFVRHPYARNEIAAEDQRILFHWACSGCRVTPLLLRDYRGIHRECVKIFGAVPGIDNVLTLPERRGVTSLLRTLQRSAVPAAACLAAMLVLPGAARGDDPHWQAVADDEDGDYLSRAEEVLAGLDWGSAYTTGDSLVDGVYLAHFLSGLIDALPNTPQADRPYKSYEYQYGTETCDICGHVFNMGDVRLINPERSLDVAVPIIAQHYLEHGSLSYMGSVHDGRVDLSLLKRVLLVEDESHYLTYPGDVDSDGLFPEEETYLGTDSGTPDSDGDSVKDGPQYFEDLIEALSGISRAPSQEEPYIQEWRARGSETCEICGKTFNMGGMEITNPAENASVFFNYIALHYLAHGSARYDGSLNDGRLLPVLLNTVLTGDGHTHWLEVADDSDSDGLKDDEESHFGMDPEVYDSDGNGIPDGAQLAAAMHSVIAGLPEGETPDTTYVINYYMDGVYPCLICGENVNMGYMEIVNPQSENSILLPYYNLHFMEHGSFETDRLDLYPRVDPRDIDNVIDVASHIPGQPGRAGPVMVFPNPFTHRTRISLNLRVPSVVDITIYDVYGREKYHISSDGEKKADFFWHGTDAEGHELPSGVYFCRFAFGDTTLTKKVMLLR